MTGFVRRRLLREGRQQPLTEQEQDYINFLVELVKNGTWLDPMPSTSELEDWALQLMTTLNTIGFLPLRRKKDIPEVQRIIVRHLAVLKGDIEDRLKKLTS